MIVRNKFTVSQGILQNDYFSYLLPYLSQKEKNDDSINEKE